MLDDSEARLQHVAMAASGQLCAGLAYTEIQSFPIPSLTQASLSVSVTPHEAGGILDLTGLREMKLDPPQIGCTTKAHPHTILSKAIPHTNIRFQSWI